MKKKVIHIQLKIMKNKKLYKAVQSASWDDVVLDDKFKEGLRRDTKTFFASNAAYDSLGITWKRGILLLGPAGVGGCARRGDDMVLTFPAHASSTRPPCADPSPPP